MRLHTVVDFQFKHPDREEAMTGPASQLWKCQDPKVWAAVHKQFNEAIKCKHDSLSKKKPSQLLELQSWFAEELPLAVAGRKEPHIIKQELVKLVEWKLARDTWRPKLVQYAADQDEAVVQATTRRALKLLPAGALASLEKQSEAVGKAMAELTSLKGVGPGTASALLCAVCPEGWAPYMSPPAMAVSGCAPSDYTQKAYLKMLQALQIKCEALKAAGAGVEVEGVLTPKGLEECLFTADVLQDLVQGLVQGHEQGALESGQADEPAEDAGVKKGPSGSRPAKRAKK